MGRLVVGAAAFALVIGGCGIVQPHSVISTGPDGLRTFSVIRAIDGTPVVCAAFGLANPVVGTLQGNPRVPHEPVWLLTDDGRRLSVVWPEGFTVRFEPEAVLYNDQGRAVSRQGARTELSQVSPGEHAGTFDDPYIASGILFNDCYVFLR